MTSVPSSHRVREDPRTQRNRRIWAVLAFAMTAFVVGAIVGARHGSSSASSLSLGFVRAWSKDDFAAMYADIDTSSQRSVSVDQFANAYQGARITATTVGMKIDGHAREVGDGVLIVPVTVDTKLFGKLHETFSLHVNGSGKQSRIAWTPSLEFPGLRTGEQLTRHTSMPPRASILARDGSVLASGEASSEGGSSERSSPLGAAAEAIVGSIGPIPSSERTTLESQGLPRDATVGTSGLELALDSSLRGHPGGKLLAGERVLASTPSRPSAAVRTTVAPELQRVAVSALGGKLGGVVALEPRTGEILAVAGIGLDDLQPPGSTFKMVTVTSVLAAGVSHSSSTFPYETYSTLDGVKLSNANGESCGGTLALAFAVSCNSVFAPLGVKLGAARLVATAERYGFNHPAGIPGAVESTLPKASEIQGELDVGSTAIGQGRVQASTLQMALVAATIADGGKRPKPTFVPTSGDPAGVTVSTPTVARSVRKMMIGVVREGTGTSAAIPGVTVAGKTGTAELGGPSTCKSSSESSEPDAQSESESESDQSCDGSSSNPENTDAWFAAFAPALSPKIVVAVMLVRDGAGGDTAAPAAREVLESALSSHL
jgi:penicillin-binding protein A